MTKNTHSGLFFVRPFAAILLTVGVFGCAAQPGGEAARTTGRGELSRSQEKGLVQAHDEWIDAVNRGDNQRGLAAFTEDAAMIAPAGPISHGSDELRQMVERLTSVPGLHVEFMLTKASVSPDGRVGFVVGDSKISAPNPDGTLRTTSQRLLTIWRKDEAGGKWRCYVEAVMPPPAEFAP